MNGGDTNLYGYVLNDPVNKRDSIGLKVSECYLLAHTSIKIDIATHPELNRQWGFGPKNHYDLLQSFWFWSKGDVTSQKEQDMFCKEIYSDDARDKAIYNRIQKDIKNPPAYHPLWFNCVTWSANILNKNVPFYNVIFRRSTADFMGGYYN